jgi:hypothetical protein
MLHPLATNHVNHDRPIVGAQQEVNNVPAYLPLHFSTKHKRLSDNSPDLRIEVDQHQIGQLQSRLIDHMVALR